MKEAARAIERSRRAESGHGGDVRQTTGISSSPPAGKGVAKRDDAPDESQTEAITERSDSRTGQMKGERAY